MDRETWHDVVHGVAKSRTRLSDWTEMNWTDGLIMPLDSPSGSGSARHLCFNSCFRMSLSAYLQCCRTPTCPWDHHWCFCYPAPPSTADRRGLCGSFLVPSCCGDLSGFPCPLRSPSHLRAHAHFSLFARPTVCVKVLVCACLCSAGTPSSPWGFCSLVSAFRARPLHCGACVHLSWLPWPAFSSAGFVSTVVSSLCLPSVLRGLCVLVLSHQPALIVAGFMCSSFGPPGRPSVPRGLCARPKFVSLSLHPGPTLCTTRVVCPSLICVTCPTRLLGPPLCARRVVCAGEVSVFPLSVPWAHIQLGPQSVSC